MRKKWLFVLVFALYLKPVLSSAADVGCREACTLVQNHNHADRRPTTRPTVGSELKLFVHIFSEEAEGSRVKLCELPNLYVVSLNLHYLNLSFLFRLVNLFRSQLLLTRLTVLV